MSTRNHFLLIVNRAENLDGGWIPALEMSRRRLDAGLWGLYANTPHRKQMAVGDEMIVYLAGPDDGAQSLVARATAGQVTAHGKGYLADGDALTDPPVAVLEMSGVAWLDQPVRITAIKDHLGFIPKGTNKWGCVMQRGVKRVSAEDAAKILRGAPQ